jgi:guanidinopropionase
MKANWPRRVSDPVVQMLVPRLYGNTPSLFGAPIATREEDLRGAQVAFLGIPWRAPTPDTRMGRAAANYEGTQLTPSQFRINSLRYGGYLPELDLDVFARLRFVDCGDVDVVSDMGQLLASVEARVTQIVRAGCFPFTMGGNAGPSTYAVLKAIAGNAGGPTAVLNFDAHHDNRRGEWEEDDPRLPQWGSAWARRILGLPGVDPAQYYHVGLRGPRNDPEVFTRFLERGVRRDHIYTYREIKRARRSGFDEWAASLAVEIVARASKVWIAFDPDVLNLGASPDFGDEPLGPTTEEVLTVAYEVGKAAGPKRFGGLGIMALPYDAQTMHSICVYLLLYTLAGVLSHTAAA